MDDNPQEVLPTRTRSAIRDATANVTLSRPTDHNPDLPNPEVVAMAQLNVKQGIKAF